MKKQSFDKTIEEIETSCADELMMLLDIDIKDCTTDYLKELWIKWQKRNIAYDKYFKKLLLIGASAPIWLGLGIMLHLMTDNEIFFLIAILCPISVIIFAYGLINGHRQFGGKSTHDSIGLTIIEELNTRRHDGLTPIQRL